MKGEYSLLEVAGSCHETFACGISGSSCIVSFGVRLKSRIRLGEVVKAEANGGLRNLQQLCRAYAE